MVRRIKDTDISGISVIKPTISEDIITERLKRQENGEVEFLVLEESGNLVSFGLLKWRGKPSHPEYPDIEDLYTLETERGKGYGSRLISEFERLAKERGYKKIGLAVNPTLNPMAKKLYENHGYHPDGKPAYIDGIYNGTEDWVIDMEKKLK